MADQKALTAGSRSFRECFIAQVPVVTTTCQQDFGLGNEMQLAPAQHDRYTESAASALVLLYTTTVRKEAGSCRVFGAAAIKHAVVHMLRPLHASASDMAWNFQQLAAQQLAHQMTVKWPGLSSITLNNVKYRPWASRLWHSSPGATGHHWSTWASARSAWCGLNIDAQCLSLLLQGDWPALRSIDVSNLLGDKSSLLWPAPKSVDELNNCVDAEGMALLAKGNWTLLNQPRLRYYLDATAIAHLLHSQVVSSCLGGCLYHLTPPWLLS